MVYSGLRLDFLGLKCASKTSHLCVFILGLILTYYTRLSFQASGKYYKSQYISATYQHCVFHPDGVHDLDCFMKRELPGKKWICMWKPGRHTSKKIYTLIVQQHKNHGRVYTNLSGNSEKITIFERMNFTAQVLDTESKNCTKAIFRGSPKSLLRCGPPYNATFRRRSRRLYVNVSWQQNEEKLIQNYIVRYKALGSLLWNESSVQYQKEEGCTVENLNSSLVYTVQIKCVTNKECSQCPWSETYTIPPELTVQPVLTNLEEADLTKGKGRRLLSLNWEFSAKMFDGFYVTIGKALGEPPSKRMITTRTQIRLILSYSAYHVHISAFNNVSISPGSSWTIKKRSDNQISEVGQLNVTVQSNTSFTVYWKDPLIEQYVCYSVEWTKKGHKAAHMSFFEDMKNYKELSNLPEPLEPYKRYSLSLHTRQMSNENTCNMQYINGSEATYGSTQFYYMEGLPVSAPANISSHSVTLNSAVVQWSPIPEEEARGFLLGYMIHYTEYHDWAAHTEKNMTVAPELNSFELGDLKTGTAYQVQISGFTRAGSGVRSITTFFRTHHQAYFTQLGVVITLIILVIVLIFASPLLKRVKAVLWPSIPNPENSKAMQKLQKSCELELLESINTLKVEEYDTNSLQIIEKDAATPFSTLPSILPLLHNSEEDEDEDIPDVTCDWTQRDTDGAAGDAAPDNPADTQHTDLNRAQSVFTSGYTTMEMFQQVMPQTAHSAVRQDVESELEKVTAWTVARPGLGYIHQFSTESPVLDHEDISTVLKYTAEH